MRKPFLIAITIILIVVLLAAEIFIVRSASSFQPRVDAVFAKVPIPAGTVIAPDMLEVKSVEADFAHRLSAGRLSDVAGKQAKTDLAQGEMILSSRLGAPDDMKKIQMENKSHRLFTIEFKPDQANGWQVKPGQHVDIIFVPNNGSAVPGMQTRKPDISQPAQGTNGSAGSAGNTQAGSGIGTNPGSSTGVNTVKRLDNIRIAAVLDDKGQLCGNPKAGTLPALVCFEVDDAQDEFLAWAKHNGKLELSVRNGN